MNPSKLKFQNLPWLLVLLSIALLVIPRVIHDPGAKPFMHDESMFAWYGWSHANWLADKPGTNHYVHLPILHGPALILGIAHFIHWFGDSATVARSFISVCSIIALFAAIFCLPRRYRWWFAPVLLLSPILIYYSRFLRNEMLFNMALLVGMACVLRGVSWKPTRALWMIPGLSSILGMLAIKENAIFLYANGIVFWVVWLAVILLWRKPVLAWRPRPVENESPPTSDKPASRYKVPEWLQRETYAHPSFAEVVGDQKPAAAPASSASSADTSLSPRTDYVPRRRRPTIYERLFVVLCWVLGVLGGIGILAVVYGHTLPPNIKTWYENLYASWTYWEGQHSEHRIEGALHYHLPILAIYELPAMLMLYLGLFLDAIQRKWRLIFHLIMLAGGMVLLGLWHLIDAKAGGMGPLDGVIKFLHIAPSGSMLALGLLFTPLLSYAVLALKEHRPAAAWMAWWAAASLFQYSSAGEKVPWLAAHIALPYNMALCWVWAPLLRRREFLGERVSPWSLFISPFHAARALYYRCLQLLDQSDWAPRVPILNLTILLLVAVTLLNARNSYFLIFERSADARERLVYNHTPVEFDKECRSIVATWQRLEGSFPLHDRKIYLVDAAGWPGFWYFRNCQPIPRAPGFNPGQPLPTADLILGPPNLLNPIVPELDLGEWSVKQMNMREHWMAPPLWGDYAKYMKWTLGDKINMLWRYWWLREPWTEEGNFPVLIIEPLTTRRNP